MAELIKLINNSKVRDIHNFQMDKIEETKESQKHENIPEKTTYIYQLCAVKDENGYITNDRKVVSFRAILNQIVGSLQW